MDEVLDGWMDFIHGCKIVHFTDWTEIRQYYKELGMKSWKGGWIHGWMQIVMDCNQANMCEPWSCTWKGSAARSWTMRQKEARGLLTLFCLLSSTIFIYINQLFSTTFIHMNHSSMMFIFHYLIACTCQGTHFYGKDIHKATYQLLLAWTLKQLSRHSYNEIKRKKTIEIGIHDHIRKCWSTLVGGLPRPTI
jgi:hypothetical protein